MSLAKRIWEEIREFFKPTYNETSVFLMALSFVLLVLFDADLKTGIKGIISKAMVSDLRETTWAIIAAGLFITGSILSIFHAFSSRTKTEFEKRIMLVFALGINGVVGIVAGIRILNDYHGLLIVFPALNIFSSVVLLYLIGFADPTMLEDANASLWELFVGSVITIAIFSLCQFWLDLHWSITFSICVAYAMIANEILGRLLIRKTA